MFAKESQIDEPQSENMKTKPLPVFGKMAIRVNFCSITMTQTLNLKIVLINSICLSKVPYIW